MLIHFVAPQWDILDQIDDFRKIIQVIHNEGHSLTRDWVEPAYEIAKKGGHFDQLDCRDIYHENMEAIARADLVIIEATTQNFSVGYQTAMAIQQKKPTLVLEREGAVSTNNFLSGIDSNLLSTKAYTGEELEKIVLNFINENRIDNKDLRFNFFIDRQIYNYLRWASFKTGKTKAEILRELVQNEINRHEQ